MTTSCHWDRLWHTQQPARGGPQGSCLPERPELTERSSGGMQASRVPWAHTSVDALNYQTQDLCVSLRIHYTRINTKLSVFSSFLERPDLGLQVGLQTQQAPDLCGFGVDDAGAHEVGRIRIDLLKERRAKPDNLRKRNGGGGRGRQPRPRAQPAPSRAQQCPNLGTLWSGQSPWLW